MKNTLFLSVFLAGMLLLASCGTKNENKIEKLSDIQGKVVGNISSGTSKEGNMKMISKLIGGDVKDVVFFSRGMDVIAALEAGKIDACPGHKFAADYLLKRKPNLKAIPVEAKIEGYVIIAVRAEDSLLRNDLNKAIETMEKDGTLKDLEDKWITNLPADNEPSATTIPKIENAKTIYVGISGEYPPLDYISADGKPAGFNVAIFEKISKLLNINFEFVSIENQARFQALNSKKIDLIFTHFQSNNTEYFDEFKNNTWIGTIPYFTYKGGVFLVKK